MARLVFASLLLFSVLGYAQSQQPGGNNMNSQDPNQVQGAPGQQKPEEVEFSVSAAKSVQSYLAPFRYNSSLLRNPFLHPELAIPLVPGETYGPFLPLQQFQLAELKVNGLFWNTTKPKAIITTPKGDAVGVGLKDFIGENFGYVAAIREKEMVVIQTLEEDGQKYTTTKILFLSDGKRREQ